MSEIQQTRYDHLLRRVAGLIGPGSKVGDAITELLPTIDVENVPGELLALMGTRVALGHTTETGVAAVNQRSQLFNPEGSSTIITLTTLFVETANVQRIQFGLVDTALTTLSNVRAFRDSRLPLGPVTVGQIRTDTDAAIEPVGSFGFVAAVNESIAISDPNGVAVLSPGFGLQVTTATVNTNLIVGYLWRERPAEQSELSF